MKSIFKTLAAAAAIAVGMSPAFAQDKVVKMGTMTWEDMLPITLITKKALENKGYTVEVTEFAEWGIAYAALTRGDVELMVSQTDYIAQDYWDKNKDALEKLSVVGYGVYQAFAVPSYVNISSTEELNANAEMLGGKIIGVEPGSGLMREANIAMTDYGLTMELVEGSTAAMTAALDAAVSRQEPIVVALWEPSWMFSKYDMKFLADPKGIFAPPQAYHLIAQKGFTEAKPEASEIVGGVYVPLADIGAINEAMKDGTSVQDATQAWIDAHADLMTRWANIKSY